MEEWSRDNGWRQGHVIPSDLARKLDLAGREDAHKRLAVVVSHDCDIAQPVLVEPKLEVIPAKVVEELDGGSTYAKNPRKLHLPLTTPSGEVFVELLANAKMAVEKDALAGIVPDANFTLTPERHSILQFWLAARYRRAAFPDAFEQRFAEQTKLKDRLTAILKPVGEHIVAVFFDIDDGTEVERQTPEDTYALDIYLVYNTMDDPAEAKAAAYDAEKKIKAACKTKLVDGGKWKYIELRACYVMSDQALTYRQSRDLQKWNIDYISLRDEPQQAMLRE